MADVNDIIAYGFGSWSSVNSIPTLGFGIGSAEDITCITAEIEVEAPACTVESRDELSGAQIVLVQPHQVDMAIPADDNTWTPDTQRRTWRPAEKVRTWKA